MKYIKNTLDFHVEEPTVISLGKFDGIHRGRELLMDKIAQKKEEGLKAAIFTFDNPPKKNVEQIEAKVLTTNEEKMHIFEGIGIDYLIECPFTREVMCMEPEDFIRMLVEKLNVKCIVAGEDFHFGHNRRGDYQMLKKYAPVYGYEALILSKMKEVAYVNYPGLPSSKYYERARKYLPHGGCGVVSFGLKGGREAASAFMQNLKLGAIETHVADARTCCLNPATSTHRQMTDEQLKEAGVPAELIRISLGLEDKEDLIADISNALDAIRD